MPVRKQITVFLENKPGRLANVLSAMAQAKINLTALSVMDTSEHSVLRLVSDDAAATVKILQGLNVQHSTGDVLIVELRNQPGALARVCEMLGAEKINIDHAYCSSGGRNGRVYGVFKLSNLDKAQKVLAEPAASRRPERRPVRDQRVYRRA